MPDIIVFCEAQDHALALHIDHGDGLVYLSLYTGNFYARQTSFLGRWRRRLALAVTAVLGRDYLLDDVVLSRDSAISLARAIEQPGPIVVLGRTSSEYGTTTVTAVP